MTKVFTCFSCGLKHFVMSQVSSGRKITTWPPTAGVYCSPVAVFLLSPTIMFKVRQKRLTFRVVFAANTGLNVLTPQFPEGFVYLRFWASIVWCFPMESIIIIIITKIRKQVCCGSLVVFVLEIPSSHNLSHIPLWDNWKPQKPQSIFLPMQEKKKLQTIDDPFGICCQQELKEERSAPCVKWRQTSRSASETLAVQDGPTFAFWIESCERRVSSASSAGQKHKASLFPHINTSFCEANSAPVKRS